MALCDAGPARSASSEQAAGDQNTYRMYELRLLYTFMGKTRNKFCSTTRLKCLEHMEILRGFQDRQLCFC